MDKPTRIIKKPYRATVAGYQRKVLVALCDDGKVYTLQDLAERVGIKKHTIIERQRIYGWDSELILCGKASPGMRINGSNFTSLSDESGTEEWHRLGCRPRDSRLLRIPRPTTIERRYL